MRFGHRGGRAPVQRFVLVGMLFAAGCDSPLEYERQYLAERNPQARLKLVERISEAAQKGSPYSVSTLRKALMDSDRDIRREAIKGLLLAAPAESDDALKVLTSDVAAIKDEAVAVATKRVQGTDTAGVARLAREMESDDEKRRREAAVDLATPGLEPAGAVSALEKALKDKSRNIRLSALFALKEWGPLAKPALPALRGMMGEACASVLFAVRRITAYYPRDYEISAEDDDEVDSLLQPFVDFPPDTPPDVRKCGTDIRYHDVVPRTLRILSRFQINGDCFDFRIEGEPRSYELYKLEVQRFIGSLIRDYADACESIAIKRMLKDAAAVESGR